MTTINCIGRRRLEIHLQPDKSYKIDLMLKDTRLATLLIDREEAAKLRARLARHSKSTT